MANFDLSKVNETSPLVIQFKTAFQKASGQAVTAFIAQKMKKIANEATKDLDFVLENGQTVTLVVRTNGDVVRVKINGKETPLRNELWHYSPDSFQLIAQPVANTHLPFNSQERFGTQAVFLKAVEEIAEKIRKGQAAFDKKLQGQKVNVPPGKGSTSSGGSSRGTGAQLKEVTQRNVDLDKIILEKTALRDELKLKLETRENQSKALNTPIGRA